MEIRLEVNLTVTNPMYNDAENIAWLIKHLLTSGEAKIQPIKIDSVKVVK